eukprot:5111973-Pyramimonas_sp.AAC.1
MFEGPSRVTIFTHSPTRVLGLDDSVDGHLLPRLVPLAADADSDRPAALLGSGERGGWQRG